MTVADVATYSVLALVCGIVLGAAWGSVLRFMRALLN